MSHLKERKEKVCLNCNAAIYGRFCHVCGQENLEPHESFWHLVTHFLFDLIHFDGKFFSTLKYLLFKPGFLASEHSKGRRADYLHPIRLYIFVSAFFFLIMFSFYGHESKKDFFDSKLKSLTSKKSVIMNLLKANKDSLILKEKVDSFVNIIDLDILHLKTDSSNKKLYISDNLDYSIVDPEYNKSRNDSEFLSISNYLEKKEKEFPSREEFNKKIIETLVHAIPKGLFVALPFYALFLMMFYARNKKFNYVNHLLFSIYLFSFTFILILISTWLISLFKIIKVDINNWVTFIALIIAAIYTYKGLKNYYQQSTTKTILKFILLTISCFIILVVVGILLFVYSFTAI